MSIYPNVSSERNEPRIQYTDYSYKLSVGVCLLFTLKLEIIKNISMSIFRLSVQFSIEDLK